MHILFTTALVLASALALVACRSDDPEKCPTGERTLQVTEEFTELGYPDGTVACNLRGHDTPSVLYNGVDSEEEAAAKLIAFMRTKGYEGKPRAPGKMALEIAQKGGRISTGLLFVKQGASVRYIASLMQARDGRMVTLSWLPVDCAAKPTGLGCQE